MHAIVVLFPASCWRMSVSSEFTHASDVQNSESRLFKSLHQVFVYQACFYICAVIVQREKFFHLNKFNRSILLQRKKLLWLAIQWACETDQGFSRTMFQHRLMKSKRCGFACLTVRSNCGGNAVSQSTTTKATSFSFGCHVNLCYPFMWNRNCAWNGSKKYTEETVHGKKHSLHQSDLQFLFALTT